MMVEGWWYHEYNKVDTYLTRGGASEIAIDKLKVHQVQVQCLW